MSNELWLSLDLASPTASLALHRVESGTSLTLVDEASVGQSGSHTERLLPVLQETLARSGKQMRQIDRYVLPRGPGSFTGLRIGMATAKAFALAFGRPIELLSGAEARARSWRQANPTAADEAGRLSVLTEIARDRVGLGVLERSGDGAWVWSAEQVVSHDEALEASRGLILLDERLSNLPRFRVPNAVVHALHARHLAEALPLATSRSTHAGPQEWIQASPAYLGETKFKTVG